MIIELSQYVESRRRTDQARVTQIGTVSRAEKRVVRQGAAVGILAHRGSGAAGRWSRFLPLIPALELAGLYADASLI